MYAKTFKIDPQTGETFEACDRPGKGVAICSIYGSQMPHTVIGRRVNDEGLWEGARFTNTEWADKAIRADWDEVRGLVHGQLR